MVSCSRGRPGAQWSYLVVFQEVAGSDRLDEDVQCELVAVLALPRAPKLCSEPVQVHYVPSTKLRRQSEAQRRELQERTRERAALLARKGQLKALMQQKELARAKLDDAIQVNHALGTRPTMEEALSGAVRELTRIAALPAFDPPAAILHLISNEGLTNFLRDRRDGRLDARVADAVVGVVGELGHAADRWAADAVAAVAGDRLQAVVVRTERDLDVLWAILRYRGLQLLALERRGRRAPPVVTRGGWLDFSRESGRCGNRPTNRHST